MWVEGFVHCQGDPFAARDRSLVVTDVDTSVGEVGIVERLEGAELVSTDLTRSIASHQVVLEEEGDLRYPRPPPLIPCCCDLDGCDEVLLAVRTEPPDRELRAREDDGLVQPLEDEAECRGGIGHRVGAVQDHEAVVAVIVLLDDRGQPYPVLGGDGRGV